MPVRHVSTTPRRWRPCSSARFCPAIPSHSSAISSRLGSTSSTAIATTTCPSRRPEPCDHGSASFIPTSPTTNAPALATGGGTSAATGPPCSTFLRVMNGQPVRRFATIISPRPTPEFPRARTGPSSRLRSGPQPSARSISTSIPRVAASPAGPKTSPAWPSISTTSNPADPSPSSSTARP